ncbi:Lcl domain-containing protein [Roseateles sp. GG27B]
MNIRNKFAMGLLAGAAMASAAQASFVTLTQLDSQQVQDSSTNLVWASDWNLAQTSGYDADGRMTWDQSTAWIASLNTGNYAGHNDWRLPTTNTAASSNCDSNYNPGGGFSQQYYGFGCSGSEMGHLFYEALGGKQHESILDQSGDTAATSQSGLVHQCAALRLLVRYGVRYP